MKWECIKCWRKVPMQNNNNNVCILIKNWEEKDEKSKELEKNINKWENIYYHNPSLGLTTKARAYKGAGQEGSPGVISHDPRSAKECEGMNLHTPKWVLILGVGTSNELPNFQRMMQGSKLNGLRSYLYH
jgi:hypothetical protein